MSVPISSSGPHLPQFLYFSAAWRRSSRVTLRPAIGCPSLVLADRMKTLCRARSCRERAEDDSIADNPREDGMTINKNAARVSPRSARASSLAGVGLGRGHLSGPQDPHDRAVRGRRADRRDRAPGGGAAVRRAGPAGLCGEPARRRRQSRRRDRQARRAGRLHHLRRLDRLHHQSEHVHHHRLRSAQGFCADLAGRGVAQCDHRASFGAGEKPQRADRPDQGQSRTN